MKTKPTHKFVYILHQRLCDDSQQGSAFQWQLSNEGVMQEVGAVADVLTRQEIPFEIVAIGSLNELISFLDTSRCDALIFNLVEELPGPNMVEACFVPEICEAYGHATTGNSTKSLLLCLNKWKTKQKLLRDGVNTPKGICINVHEDAHIHSLEPGKYIVKPNCSDASEWIDYDSIVNVPGMDFVRAIKRIHKEANQPALVERFIDGREFNVSVIQTSRGPKVMPLAEIDLSRLRENHIAIIDYSAKWEADSFAYNNTPRVIPAPLEPRVESRIRQAALDAWQAGDCRDYARIDFRMADDEIPQVIEVNPNPDISLDAGFAAAIDAGGISYDEFVTTTLDNAAGRMK